MGKKHHGSTTGKPDGYDASAFPSFAVTVDIVILTVVMHRLMVLLIKRSAEPYADSWALPGGFKRPDETLDEAAARELLEETSITPSSRLSQFGAYGDPQRDPRTNVVTIGYLAITPNLANPTAGSDAAEAQLWAVDDVLNGKVATAFDHSKIIADAVSRARSDLEQTDLALSFVGKTFTVRELQTVFEAIWGATLEPANFRRSLLASTKFIVETTTVNASGKTGGRPALSYKATKAWRDGSPIRRPQTT